MTSKPWRQLKNGSLVIPVIRRHQGSSEWGPQHEIRVAAYCDLIEKSTGGEASFGVILFAGTSDCVIIPNTNARHMLYDRAFKSVANFLERQATGAEPPGPPSDRRCVGCPHVKPRLFRHGKSETISNGKPLRACTANGVRDSDGQFRGAIHSECGDRFKWVPPHKDAIGPGIAREGSNASEQNVVTLPRRSISTIAHIRNGSWCVGG